MIIYSDFGQHTFVVFKSSRYKIELWGASGRAESSLICAPGRGAYTSGTIQLHSGQTLYIFVGESGDNVTSPRILSFNGGGETHLSTSEYGKGGGATDVRLSPEEWGDEVGLRSRIMVAGGGGSGQSSNYPGTGGHAGGLSSSQGTNSRATVATQTSGFAFGKGRGGYSAQSYSGGGGGYWGGNTTSNLPMDTAGGSSYISGHEGCNSVESSTNSTHSGRAFHYSSLFFWTQR
jgi:hypothetical protein